jgi:hypothetical protein
MIGKKALIIRLASLRREDIPIQIMNQEQVIAKEKSSWKRRSLLSHTAIPKTSVSSGLSRGNQLCATIPNSFYSNFFGVLRGVAGHFVTDRNGVASRTMLDL